MQRNEAPSVWVVCAAYNAAATIAHVIGQIRRAGYNVVVVDDGSTDQTAHLAGALATALVRHPINLGQGAALKTGIDYALSSGADIVVTFDADGQHRVSDIPVVVDVLVR